MEHVVQHTAAPSFCVRLKKSNLCEAGDFWEIESPSVLTFVAFGTLVIWERHLWMLLLRIVLGVL